MKLLFLISTLENDGAERAMSNITTHLPEGVEADILLNSVSAHDFPTHARVISLKMKPDNNKGLAYQLVAFCKKLPVLYGLKKKNQYDACISFMESSNICNIITGNKYCKTIVSVRTSIEQDNTICIKYLVSPLIRLFYKKADYVTTVAEGIHREMLDHFHLDESKVKTITNGFDIALIRSLAQEKKAWKEKYGIKKEDFIYATVGRLTFAKGHWHLIRAFSQVIQSCPNAKLLIIGQGEEKKYLERLIEGYQLTNKVILLSYQNNPFAILAECNIYMMTSMFEGYCNALCEALICEKPCIATDFQSSAREILAPETPVEYQNMNKIEYAKYGILTPVCSGKHYFVEEALEKQEIFMADAMIEMHQNKELLQHYRNAAKVRGEQLDIYKKVEEWMALVNLR